MDGALRPLKGCPRGRDCPDNFRPPATIHSNGRQKIDPKNNERPETRVSPGRPGSPPPELLTHEINGMELRCLWHFCAMRSLGNANLPSI